MVEHQRHYALWKESFKRLPTVYLVGYSGKAKMIRAENKPHCWLDFQGESGHKATEEVFRTIKLFSVLFLADITQLYIFATINGVVSEKGFISLCSYFTSVYMSHKKKTPLIETVWNESWVGGFLFFCFLSLVLWLHVFPEISMYLSTLCHSAILIDDSFISFAFEKRSWIPSIY